ncbi:NAD-dependent epimerase/dehydratase [Stutzerimonas stutzeri DSM 10701]|uniref:UDP-glucose 4-epimerase family protein n=1 Tax=Stutzerimonas nitrititolerans TaxID=2482751 RepID=UPI00026D6788|nr:SDR family oxidoreductase [Stutzerimonas nitrititolerans]AFN77689.1 NAD-dependent epimerase/dehydratase [Stutzerimonas stutzeri DSM 10701]
MEVLLTGGSGFVGSRAAKRLLDDGHRVTAAVRDSEAKLDTRLVCWRFEELTADQHWGAVLEGKNLVIHCAARVHVMNDPAANPLNEFRKVNVDGTCALARQAAEAGVGRFIFISSIKVNGEGTSLGLPYRADDIPAPEDFYGISKLEAEQGLMKVAADTGMEVVIVRPPLVYGPGVKGNFASMAKLMEKGLPLPLGAIHNKRSLIGIDNLVDLLIRCIDHPAAANQVFLAGDGEDLSTTELLRGVANAMGKPTRLIPVPAGLLQFGATLLGKKAMAQRLLGSLQVDISKTCELLDWKPPYTVEEGLRRCFEPSH